MSQEWRARGAREHSDVVSLLGRRPRWGRHRPAPDRPAPDGRPHRLGPRDMAGPGPGTWRVVSGALSFYLGSWSAGFGSNWRGFTAHRVLLGLLPLLIDLRVLLRERVRNQVGFLQLFMHPELVVLFVHVSPDSATQRWACGGPAAGGGPRMPRPGDPAAILQTVWPSSPTGRQHDAGQDRPGRRVSSAPAGLRRRSEPGGDLAVPHEVHQPRTTWGRACWSGR